MSNENRLEGKLKQEYNDQLDLINIIKQIWSDKIIIIISMVICFIIGALYAFTAQEKWSSVAIVTLPDSGQISAYTQVQSVLFPLAPPLVRDTQIGFFNRFQGGLSALSLQLQNQDKKESLNSEALSKDRPDQLKVSYTGDSAKQAQKALLSYLKKIDSEIVTDIDGDLLVSIHARSNELKNNIDSLEKVAKEKKNDRLNTLNQALTISLQSGIKKPELDNSSMLSNDTLFTLGSDALSAMIKNYKDSPLPLTDDYYTSVQNLLSVESLDSQKRVMSTFKYILKPNLPVRKDSPKRMLIMIISILFGVSGGTVIILIKNYIKEYG